MGAGTTLFALLFAPFEAIAGTAELDDFKAAWAYRGGSKQRERARRSIQEVADQMPMMGARVSANLEKIVLPSAVVGMDVADRRLTIVRPGWPVLRLEVGGGAVRWEAPNGRTMKVTARLSGRTLTLAFVRGASRMRRRYRLSGDGRQLHEEVRMEHERMPSPLDVKFTYARK